MTPPKQRLLCIRICLVIVACVRCVITEDVELQCDEFDRCEPNCYFEFYNYKQICTVTGLLATHSQDVIVKTRNQYKRVSAMKFKKSSLLYIPQPIFSEFAHLQRLDISSSGIIELTPNTFTSANKLVVLDLSYNNISETTGYVFQEAKDLKYIDMSYNRITTLRENTFSGLKFLETVNLAHNQISIIDVGVFGKLNSLNHVSLADNELEILDPNWFVNSSNSIISIDVSRNRLKRLYFHEGNFKEINAENNEIESFAINCTNTENNVDCSSLLSLRLSNNRLNNLKNLINLPNLRNLSVSHNKIGKINISTLAKLRNLERLDLKNTSISGLTFGTFSQQRKLVSIDLSENNLQHLNLDIFLPYMSLSLEELFLNGNNLSEFEGHHTFSSFPGLMKLYLSGNKFNCSYLHPLISLENFQSNIKFKSDDRHMQDDGEHIHGIECILSKEAPLKGDNGFMTNSIMSSETSDHLKLQEQQLKLLGQYLLIIVCFVIFQTFLSLFLAYKGITIFTSRKRIPVGNKMAYRQSNSILS